MKNRYLKVGFAGIALLGGAFVGLVVYSLTAMPITELVICSADTGSIRLPSGLCEYYMKHYRGNDEDMQELAIQPHGADDAASTRLWAESDKLLAELGY